MPAAVAYGENREPGAIERHPARQVEDADLQEVPVIRRTGTEDAAVVSELDAVGSARAEEATKLTPSAETEESNKDRRPCGPLWESHEPDMEGVRKLQAPLRTFLKNEPEYWDRTAAEIVDSFAFLSHLPDSFEPTAEEVELAREFILEAEVPDDTAAEFGEIDWQ